MKGIRPARGTCSTYPEGMRQQMQPVIQPVSTRWHFASGGVCICSV